MDLLTDSSFCIRLNARLGMQRLFHHAARTCSSSGSERSSESQQIARSVCCLCHPRCFMGYIVWQACVRRIRDVAKACPQLGRRMFWWGLAWAVWRLMFFPPRRDITSLFLLLGVYTRFRSGRNGFFPTGRPGGQRCERRVRCRTEASRLSLERQVDIITCSHI